MTWLKQNWFKVSIIILIAVIFYWFELRPANIRAECKKYVADNQMYSISDLEREALGQDMDKINRAEREKSDWWYKDCLNGKGLKE